MSTTPRSSVHETINEVIAGIAAVLLVALTVHAARATAVTALGFFSLATLCLATAYFSAEVARQSGSESPLSIAFTVPFLMLCNAHVIAGTEGGLVFALIMFTAFIVTPCVAALQGDTTELIRWLAQPAPLPFVAPLRLRIPAHPQVARASCQVCGERLTHDVVTCARCDTPHHADCFSYAEKCSTYGCGCRRAA